MANWDDLPPELRLMIWKILAGDVRKSKNLRQHRRTGYATVCRQWQAYFDRFNLRQLVLSPACIPYLNEYVPQYKRPMVQRIWLRVEMPPYYCTPCCGFVMEEDSDENNMILTHAIFNLFTALSSWDFIGRRGIILELSIHSPCDTKHFFKNRTIHAVEWTGDECFEDEDESRALLARTPIAWDTHHGWEDGRQVIPVRPDSLDRKAFEDAKRKLLGTPLQIVVVADKELPSVNVILGFIVRRQFHRRLAPDALGRILRALPALRSMQYEFWCPTTIETIPLAMERLTGYQEVFKGYLPPSLKRLSFFEDFDNVFRKPSQLFQRTTMMRTIELGRCVRDASTRLEELFIAFFPDTTQLFAPYYDAYRLGKLDSTEDLPCWPNMTVLALTHQVLSPNYAPRYLSAFLHAAGCAAERMPKLKILELWNGNRHYGAVFRYERSCLLADGRRQEPVITVTTSWDANIRLEPGVIEKWRSVALKHTGRELVVETRAMPVPRHSYGSVLRYLKLRRLIVHPISLHQILWEAEHPDGFSMA